MVSLKTWWNVAPFGSLYIFYKLENYTMLLYYVRFCEINKFLFVLIYTLYYSEYIYEFNRRYFDLMIVTQPQILTE